MRVEDIEIHVDDGDRPYRTVGEIKAQVGAATIFSKTPTIEDVNLKLREAASKVNANGVVGVIYDRGVTGRSWKGLKARGNAVVFEERASAASGTPVSTVAEQLEALIRLRDKGELTQDEYEAQKQKLLNG